MPVSCLLLTRSAFFFLLLDALAILYKQSPFTPSIIITKQLAFVKPFKKYFRAFYHCYDKVIFSNPHFWAKGKSRKLCGSFPFIKKGVYTI
jgi:hypothetical protein